MAYFDRPFTCIASCICVFYFFIFHNFSCALRFFVMVQQSNRSITVSNLSDEAFSHWIYADAMKLINSSSSEEVVDSDDSDDDEEFWFNTKFISTIQLTIVNSSRYLFRIPHWGDVRHDFSAPNTND
jgi:hypothetical protein